jgi:hypothetical protein
MHFGRSRFAGPELELDIEVNVPSRALFFIIADS